MKIIILNGSPKGEDSITLQYCLYAKRIIKDHEFSSYNISSRIKVLENNSAKMQELLEAISNSDGIIWSFPVYHLLVPAQYKRFIELVFENKEFIKAFSGKHAVSISSSAHFYDNLAHKYIHGISEDLGMLFHGSLSAEMEDLLNVDFRKNLITFFNSYIEESLAKTPIPKRFNPVVKRYNDYVPPKNIKESEKGKHSVLVVTDSSENDVSLNNMINVFKKKFPGKTEIVNLNSIDIRGGCLGCCRCGYDGTCIYKDKLSSFFDGCLRSYDLIVFALSIKDRYFSSAWKYLWDRSFYHGHRPVLDGKHYLYLISGPLRDLPDVIDEIYARAEIANSDISGIVTDEYDDSDTITKMIEAQCIKLIKNADSEYIPTPTFLGIGGAKVLRDLVYGLKGIFREDDIYYTAKGLYDFPQKKWKNRAFNIFVKVINHIPVLRKKIYENAVKEMVKPHKNIVENC